MAIINTLLKSLPLWQIITLVVVLFGAAGATYGGYVRFSAHNQVKLEANQQLIPVKFGSLVNEISTNGNLTFPNHATLVFGSPGVVEDVLVEEGSRVKMGQIVAKLDSSAVASLSQAVSQAQLDLKNAEDTMKEMTVIDPLVLAQAWEKVASAAFQLQDALEALDDAKQPYSEQEIYTQRKLVADTNYLLDTAKQTLTDLPMAHRIKVAQARETQADSRLNLDAAQQALGDFARYYTQELAAARQEMADAEFALGDAQESLSDLPRLYASELAQARQAKSDAEVFLAEAQEASGDYTQDHNLELATVHDASAKNASALYAAEQAKADFEQEHRRQLAQTQNDEREALADLKRARDDQEAYEERQSRRLAVLREEKAEFDVSLAEVEDSLSSAIRSAEAGQRGLDHYIQRLETAKELFLFNIRELQDSLLDAEVLKAKVLLAEADLQIAQQDLARLEAGPDPLQRRQLQTAVDVTQTALEEGDQNLIRLQAGPDPLVRQGLAAVVAIAQADLTKAQQDLAGLQNGPDELRRQQRITALEVAQSNLDAAGEALSNIQAKGSSRSVAPQDARVSTAAEELLSAEHGLAGMKASRADPSEIADQETLVVAARTALATSEGILVAITAGADPLELASKEAKLSLAQVELVDSELDLAGLLEGLDPLEVAAQEAEVIRLKATLAQGKEDLAKMMEGADSAEVVLKEKQVYLAEASLADAKELLDEVLKGPDPAEVELLQAKLTSARQELQNTRQLLEDHRLKSPFDGIVATVNVEAGDEVQPRTPIVEIVDPSVIEVDGIVDEVDVLSVRQGTSAKVTVDALPGAALEGVVTRVSPGAETQQGVVAYPISIDVTVPPGVSLQEGLSAVASIVLREEKDVLLLPQQALYGSFDSPVVKVLNDQGTIEERPVVLGNTDDFWVAVRSGLKEGDEVAMESAETNTSRFSFGQFRRTTGSPGRGNSRGGSRGGR